MLLGPLHSDDPYLYLIQHVQDATRVAGAYLGDTFGVLPEFWLQRGLGRELLLAAFYQCRWKNQEQRYTRRGLNSFKRAHRSIVTIATALGIRNPDLRACNCRPEERPE